VLVAVLGNDSAVGLPATAEPVPALWMDRATLRASIEEAEAELARGQERLARIAHLVPGIVAERGRLEAASRWSIAESGGVAHPGLFGVQGWVPADLAGALPDALAASGVAAAIELREPTDAETPPTLVRMPRWIRPIQGLFDMLGTIPGYRELDLSASFMIALPIFAGIIIGDAGYGLLFILLPLLLRKRLTAALGGDRTYLLLSFGFGALAWGALAGVWFSVPATAMAESGGAIGTFGRILGSVQVIRGSDDQVWTLLMKICFVAGTVHLVLAHLRRATLATAATPLADVGWAVVLVATLGVIWMLFFGSAEPLSPLLRNATLASLAGGMVLVITFASPHRSAWRRFGRGFAGSLLPLVGAFSDTLSYIRLMAVGLGGFYLGSACNLIAADVAASAGWLFGALVLVLGHAVNLALIVIAIFAHGVRLNLLEFSSHIGMRWNGHPYRPFA
jgi:V/A-type H+-transporting ATPase subunit I